MINIAHRTSALALLALLMLGVSIASQAQVAVSSDRKVGEIFVAIDSGQYQVWHLEFSTTPPTAKLVETITNGAEIDNNAGCAFSSTYHPFTTDVTANEVFKDHIDDPQFPISAQTISLATGDTQPTAIAFDSAGDSYIGAVSSGNVEIEKRGPNGALLQQIPTKISLVNAGEPWIDLSPGADTIYFTNGGTAVNQLIISSGKVSTFAKITGAELFALRVLTPGAQNATKGLFGVSGYLLVAAVFPKTNPPTSNIQLFDVNGSFITAYSAPNEINFEFLTLGADGKSFVAGNPVTSNFYPFDFASPSPVSSAVNTGPGTVMGGLCEYGAFSAAELPSITDASGKVVSSTSPITVTATLAPDGSAVNATCTAVNTGGTFDCTFSTVVPPPTSPEACPTPVTTEPTNNCFIITVNGINLANAPNGLQATYNYSQIAQAAGTSDTVSEPSGPETLACDLTSPDGTKCEVHSIDLNPDNAPGQNVYASLDMAFFSTSTAQTIVNPRGVRDGNLDLTDFVIHDIRVGSSGNSVFTVNELPLLPAATGSHSCGYISPVSNSQYNKGRTIPFKFQAIAATGICSTGPFLTNSSLNPRLVLLQLGSSDAAPHPVTYTLTNDESCSTTGCHYRFDPSSNTFILNVNSSSLQGGGTTYFGTTFDDANQIPSFSNTASGAPVATFTLN
jgi:hypothetical protein